MQWLSGGGGETAFAIAELRLAALAPKEALGLGARSRKPAGAAGSPWAAEPAPRSSAARRARGSAAEGAHQASAASPALCGICAAGVVALAASRRRRRARTIAVAAAPPAKGGKGWADDDEWDEDDEEWDEGFNPRGGAPVSGKGSSMAGDVDEDFMAMRGGRDPRQSRKKGNPMDEVIQFDDEDEDGELMDEEAYMKMMEEQGIDLDDFDDDEEGEMMDEEAYAKWMEAQGFSVDDMDSDDEFEGMDEDGNMMDEEAYAKWMEAQGFAMDDEDSDDEDFMGSPMDEEGAFGDFQAMGGFDARGFEDDDDEDWEEEDDGQYAANAFDDGLEGGVFDGMDDPPEGLEDDAEKIGAQELSLLYDDFEVAPRLGPKGTQSPDDVAAGLYGDDDEGLVKQESAEGGLKKQPRRSLEKMEEREYVVTAEGIAIRTLPDERSPRTGEILRQGEKFTAIEAVDGEGRDQRLYLRLPEGRGWVFDDEKLYPGLPSVKLVALGGKPIKEDAIAPVKRPLIAVVGRPNVGKSTLCNTICDLPNIHGAIAYDEAGVTRDRTYKEAEHTDDEGNTFIFEVIDTGGLIFAEDPNNVTFKNEIKLQIDVALQEAAACIMVVDSRTGPTADDDEIAKYLREKWIKYGLKVVLAVAKCDRLESMDLHAAEFWGLGLGEPMPVCCLHGRGVWELVDSVIDRGCGGLYPQRIRGQDAPPRPEDEAINVAIVGKPNAGKSSLLNAMIGEDRVIVSDIPGTTTDAVDAYLEADNGKVYRFVDTAGIRRKGRINAGTEWLSVNRAIKAVKRCDVALLVLDASEIMTGKQSLGNAYWCPDQQQRWIARQIEEKGAACVVVLSKWDAVPNKDEKTQLKFVQAIRSNLSGVGQWAEIVTVSSRTGQRMGKVLDAINKTMEAHKKRIPTPVLNEVVRDALLWKLPAAMAHNKKQGRIYYAVQVSAEPPQIALFCNNPKLFNANYKTYLENKLRQDLGWFGTPIQLEWRKRSERRAVSTAESWLGPRLQPSEPVFQPR